MYIVYPEILAEIKIGSRVLNCHCKSIKFGGSVCMHVYEHEILADFHLAAVNADRQTNSPPTFPDDKLLRMQASC